MGRGHRPRKHSDGMMESVRGKVVIVTGASSGIGAETAVQFAAKGAKVTITGRDEERLNDTQQKCLSAGASNKHILTIPGDITVNEVIKLIVDETVEKFGQIDVLVNNAGSGKLGSLDDVDVDLMQWDYKLNVISAVLLTQRAMPHLVKTGGSVVNVSSLIGQCPAPPMLAYCMSKAALEMFTKCAALQYARKSVRVNAVSPGRIDTPLAATIGLCENCPEAFEEMNRAEAPTYPMQRVGIVQEVAAAILYLASDQASFTTGVILPVDGGRHFWMQGVDLSN